MKSNEDLQLRKLLREWAVPDAPPSLDARMLTARRSWWRFLVTGHIVLPTPVGLALVTALIVMTVSFVRAHNRPPISSIFNLRDFQPVKNVEVRVIRAGYAHE